MRVLVECCFAERFVAAACTDREVAAENHEDEEGEDLECKAGDHDVVSYFRGFMLMGGG